MGERRWAALLAAWGILIVASWAVVVLVIVLAWTFPTVAIAFAMFAIFMGAAWAVGR